MPNVLCERCQRFDIQAFGRDPFEFRGVRLIDVIRSSQSCSFCNLLLEHLQKSHSRVNINKLVDFCDRSDRSLEPLKWLYSWYIFMFYLECSWVNFSINHGTNPVDKTSAGLNVASIDVFIGAFYWHANDPDRLRFHVAADPDTPAALSRDITGSLLDEKSWDRDESSSLSLMRSWHSECAHKHEKCRKTISGIEIKNTTMPTRCIETRWRGTESNERCHILRETSTVEDQYITLSHKWDADTNKVKTTMANLDYRLGKCATELDPDPPCISTIPGIPKVSLDTCVLAHKLGINYVWIDSLCIVQPEHDSEPESDDWNREAPKMAQYYQYAWATIAVASTLGDLGLFNFSRAGTVPKIVQLPYRDKAGEVTGSFYLQRARPDLLRREFKRDIEGSILRQRGWVYQEWTLSRRVIAFSAAGFFLFCHTSGPVSATGDMVERYDDPNSMKYYLEHTIVQKFGPLGQNILDASSQKWQEVVCGYSSLSMRSFTGDRLVALAGIAYEHGKILEAFEREVGPLGCVGGINQTRACYACGIWLRGLSELLWEQAVPPVPGSRWRWRVSGIPTWSWASMASRASLNNDGKDAPYAGLTVRWPNFHLKKGKNVVRIEKATTITVDEQTWLPQFSKPLPDWPEFEYGNENRFVLLTIRGRLLRVHIDDILEDNDADLVGEMTSISPGFARHQTGDVEPGVAPRRRPYGADLWRGVCLPSNYMRLTGWASIEHPDFHTDKAPASSEPVYALLMQRSYEKGGLLWFRSAPLVSHTFYTVLFIRRTTIDAPGWDEPYERVGVGALFGNEVSRAYESSATTTISLI